MLSIMQMKRFADKFLMETYGMKLNIPLKLNGRLASTKGRFIYYSGDERRPLRIEMNKVFVQHNDVKMVLDVLKHELVHYVLYMKRLPHSDGDKVFEDELKRLGVVSQKTINKYDIARKVQLYQCKSCGENFKRSRKLPNNGNNHRCPCGGKLLYRGKRVMT
ncbi:hypothetical protein PQE66_gp069 [Bacillus phage PBC2]|uniref:SprT-like domain-containing protein n=1 Tax=Bacillus phage PBC2 TaxID=1675029 RepID=A0A218KBW4_9CAUD|nr:hypothetical protein PQE66_gp069 [Bacillus phage PBC2]AKQ08384.1 hypothetical protein PBC2_069 [Bacillus phage PBC2]